MVCNDLLEECQEGDEVLLKQDCWRADLSDCRPCPSPAAVIVKQLLAKWQGPFSVVDKLSSTTFCVKMDSSSRQIRTYRVGMLARWESPSAICLAASMGTDDTSEVGVPMWPEEELLSTEQLNKELDELHKEELLALLRWHEHNFNKSRRTQMVIIEIATEGVLPIHSPPYCLPHSRREFVRREIGQMLRMDIIETSTSMWAAPIVLVLKKDRSLCLSVKYCKLNAVTHPDLFPLSSVDELINGLARATHRTTLDLTNGYWQLPVGVNSCQKMSIVSPFGKY